ncbi:hypothetical protein V6N12_017997 [Hibiscus sabdariffa]|uniref:Uncharacterized protein n=1 Tax=Hibiscus sabdariffa TaxID=183260 RepID=A0ABR2AU70_9ROSI
MMNAITKLLSDMSFIEEENAILEDGSTAFHDIAGSEKWLVGCVFHSKPLNSVVLLRVFRKDGNLSYGEWLRVVTPKRKTRSGIRNAGVTNPSDHSRGDASHLRFVGKFSGSNMDVGNGNGSNNGVAAGRGKSLIDVPLEHKNLVKRGFMSAVVGVDQTPKKTKLGEMSTGEDHSAELGLSIPELAEVVRQPCQEP